MTKNAATAKPSPDLRSADARALDGAVEWLMARVPDRVPPGSTPLHLASKSWAAGAAEELAARVRDRHGRHPEFHNSLADNLKKLPRLLLAYALDERQLRDLCGAIDREIEWFDNPPPRPQATADLIELARDLSVEIPADLEPAQKVLSRRLADTDPGDRRAAPVRKRFLALLFDGAGASLAAIRWRHALSGFGLPPVRSNDSVYGVVGRDSLCPPAPRLEAQIWSGSLPRWLEDLIRDLGLRVPKIASEEAAAHEARRRLEQLRRECNAISDYTESSAAYEKGWHEIEKWSAGERTKRHDARGAEVEALRGRVTAALDAALADLAARSPGSLLFVWTREFRRHVAMSPADRPQFHDVEVDAAWAHCKSLGLVLDLGE